MMDNRLDKIINKMIIKGYTLKQALSTIKEQTDFYIEEYNLSKQDAEIEALEMIDVMLEDL